jgi:hypothetical protein
MGRLLLTVSSKDKGILPSTTELTKNEVKLSKIFLQIHVQTHHSPQMKGSSTKNPILMHSMHIHQCRDQMFHTNNHHYKFSYMSPISKLTYNHYVFHYTTSYSIIFVIYSCQPSSDCIAIFHRVLLLIPHISSRTTEIKMQTIIHCTLFHGALPTG